jgi:hypothetical protein
MTTSDHGSDDTSPELQEQAAHEADREHDRGSSPGATDFVAQERDWSTYDGPVWSAAEAARRCEVPRSTLNRRLHAGAIPGATKDADGWHIPALGLALAGLAARTAPDTPPAADNGHQEPDSDVAQRLALLQAQLGEERARREGAERLAEERAARILDLQHALRALAPPPAADTGSGPAGQGAEDEAQQPAAAPGTSGQEQAPAPQPRRGLFARLRDAITGD